MQKYFYESSFLRLLPFYAFFFLLTLFVSKNIFFWDTVQLASKHAHHFYETKFTDLLLPDIIDSGHIPGFGAVLALIWIILGKSLVVSHFFMLVFLLGIVYQTNKLILRYFDKKTSTFVLILFLADPTFLGQATLISPDIALIFFFLGALNSVFENKNTLKSIFIAALFLTSMRAMMAAFAILLIDIFLNTKYETYNDLFKKLVRKSFAYIPALLIFTAYSVYHYSVKSWIAYHDESPWQENFKITDFPGLLRNTAILGWRILDFGRIFLWSVAFFIIIKHRKKIFADKNSQQIIIIFIITFISLTVSFLAYKSLNGHRYIMPFLLIFALFTSYLIFNFIENEKRKYFLFGLVFAGLILGNFWIYPEKIAQGWDSSLAQLNYFGLRKKMITYMNQNNIKIEETTSSFPNTAQIKYLELNNDTTSFKIKDSKTDKYIFYSNINNDFSDSEIDKFNKTYILLKEYKSMGVFVKLFKNKSK